MNCDQETNKSDIEEHCSDCLCTGGLEEGNHRFVPARKAWRSTNVVEERGRLNTLSYIRRSISYFIIPTLSNKIFTFLHHCSCFIFSEISSVKWTPFSITPVKEKGSQLGYLQIKFSQAVGQSPYCTGCSLRISLILHRLLLSTRTSSGHQKKYFLVFCSGSPTSDHFISRY